MRSVPGSSHGTGSGSRAKQKQSSVSVLCFYLPNSFSEQISTEALSGLAGCCTRSGAERMGTWSPRLVPSTVSRALTSGQWCIGYPRWVGEPGVVCESVE